jgi:pyruvyl transferase EpsI
MKLIISIIKLLLPAVFRYEILYQKGRQRVTKYELLNNSKKIFLFLAADYGNLGDIAITLAQKKILAQKYPDYKIIEIETSKFVYEVKAIKKICTPDDIVTIIGGGNMGDMYYGFEIYRELIIMKFKHNKIISFPQTIDFSNSWQGRKALQRAKRIYAKHPDLTVLAREEKSYQIMKEVFPKNNVCLTPDVVMTLDYPKILRNRNGVVICMRNDSEKFIKEDEYHQLIDLFEHKFESIKYYDTHIGKNNLSEIERSNELNNVFQEFSTAQLIVTDRLHGMIISYITGTPAIVLPNGNSKVENCYKWIKDCGYIQFVKDVNVDSIGKLVDTVSVLKIDMENFNKKKKYFENLILKEI